MNTPSTKHPSGLWVLFFTEMWERFSYYGMRALLVLYLTSKVINGGFGMDELSALEIYGIFTGLVYLTPILGGMLADRFMGQRKMIVIGGLVMAMGQAAMSYSEIPTGEEARTFWLYIGLGLLIIGNGFFKPNISTIVGRLYADGDPRKDSAFTIFYMGINLGAFGAPLIAGYLGEEIGWSYGFASAAVGMLLGTLWFVLQGHKLGTIGFPPRRAFTVKKPDLLPRDWMDIILWTAGSFGVVFLFVKTWWTLPENLTTLIIQIAVGLSVAGIAYVIFKNTTGKTEWSRIGAILIFCFFNIFFWSGFEQAGGTFNLFARDLTDRMIGSFEIKASWFQSINAIAIVALAPVFSMLWIRLGRHNPSTPIKFSLGLFLLSIGFVVMFYASTIASAQNLVSPLWLVLVYVLHTTGELCLSPIGLSMITKLSPPKITSLMMGLWFASTALANYLAGILRGILEKYMPDMNLFLFLVISSASAGLVLLLISPFLKRMMKGID